MSYKNDTEPNSHDSSIQTSEEPLMPIEPIDPPPPDPEPVVINQISPIAGALAGGIPIKLTGQGFQPGGEVYFGNVPATQVTYESYNVIHAYLPASQTAGSVSVTIVNPDGSSDTVAGGFTYVTTGSGEQAEVLGVSPLAVIENTETVVTLRGRNLIAAYNDGLVALRGPSRAQITFVNVSNSRDETSNIESLDITLRVTANPPLQPLERISVQVLASRRTGAANDGVVESSRQMFTVLPGSAPVPLAYTASLQSDQPNLVMVAGRNLEGCTLNVGDGATIHLQKGDDRFLSGLVTVSGDSGTSSFAGSSSFSGPLQLSLLDGSGNQLAQYPLEIAAVTNSLASSPDSGGLDVSFLAVPDQQFIGPTENDNAVFSVNGGPASSFIYDWWNFEITILDISIILPIVNEVYLIPFFDGGGDLNSPVLAQVGKLFRLRGTGLLVALRVEIVIHIRVVLIIGFIYDIWPYGLSNEFPEYGWSLGSIVIGIRIEIEVTLIFSFLIALVKPGGELEVLVAFNLTAGIDFSIDSDGRLHFDPDFTYKPYVIGISPAQNNPLPCGGKFELLAPAVPDSLGFEAQYAVHEAGSCCLPWNYDVQLLRFSPTGQPEVVQAGFQTSYCLTAIQPPAIGIKPTLAYLDASGNLVAATDSLGNEVIERLDPHETKRDYVLAAKVTSLPPGIDEDVKITFPAVTVAMTPAGSPLSLANGRPPFPGSRNSTLISDFFTGSLINRTNLTLTIPNGADLTKLFAFTDGVNKATIAPNQFEEGAKLVIPGSNVSGKETSISITLEPSSASSAQKPVSDSGNPVNLSKKVAEYPIKNEETYEEYYRVFKEIRGILHENQTTNPTQTSLNNFAKDFKAELIANGLSNLALWGQKLWKLGYQFVQGIGAAAVTDDRLLYYARLEAIAVLRNYCRRRNPSIALTTESLNRFELSSRGLETDGTTAYVKFEAEETNRVVLTGFDPFQLYGPDNLLISNSSGLIALDRHQKPITAGKTFAVRTAILPVRFRDFDGGLIERIMEKAIEDSELVVTCSWTPSLEFNIDRFAARFRGLSSSDNEGLKSQTTTNPFGVNAPFYIESSLPYTSPGVLGQNKKVGSPNPIYLFLNQSFQLETLNTSPGAPPGAQSHDDPSLSNSDYYTKITDPSKLPQDGNVMSVGSGGNYLSNEIFYRTANV